MIDVLQAISIGLQVIAAATVMLNIVAPLTKNKLDNKVLQFLLKILRTVSLNYEDKKVIIDLKK